MRVWGVKVTHVPSGITSVVTDEGSVRSTMAAKKLAESHIKSKLWAEKNIPKNDSIVATYDLPDDNSYPFDLADYRA